MSRIRTYHCRHCGRAHQDAFMAQLCFDLDMKILQDQTNQQTSITKTANHGNQVKRAHTP